MGDPRRLLVAREFDAVFNHSEVRASSRLFLVLGLANDAETSRLGMVVSKKVARNAVNRNRIRRIIRESFRRECLLTGFDFVVVARQEAGNSENAIIFSALRELWGRLEGQMVT